MRRRKLPDLTFWRILLIIFLAAGAYAAILRFWKGLGATTALSDQFPWGLWVGFDVLCGVGLAAGGFTIAATVYIFNLERFRPIVRPAVLTAFLGYGLVIFALMFDLGRPYRIWHPLVMWNPRSVMFEVAWCVMLYTAVLALEFSPIVLSHFRWERPLRVIRRVTIPLVIVGVILSTLHQSSLGSLYLIVPAKLHPYWYSPLLPVFFFLSAITVGLAMVIFESFLSSRAFGKRLETKLLTDLGRVLMVLLALTLLLRIHDLESRGVLQLLLQPTRETVLFTLEISVGFLLPMALLAFPKIREDSEGLFSAAVVVVAGFLLNRLNVSITGMEASSGTRYFPTWMEIAITLAILSLGIFLFSLAVRHLPVYGPSAIGIKSRGEAGSAV